MTEKMKITDGSTPVRLPITPAEFNDFVDALGEYSGITDIKNYQHAIATMIMHHPQDSCMKAPDAFIQAIRKAQANEVAYGVLFLIKQVTELEEKKKKQDAAAPLTTTTETTTATGSINGLAKGPHATVQDTRIQETTEQMV